MRSAKSTKLVNSILVNGALALIVIAWLVPVVGVLVSSFRQRFDIQTTPWWSVFPHRDWVMTKTVNPRELGLDPNGPMTVEGITATFEELRAGVQQGNKRLVWVGTKPIGVIQVQQRQWVTKTSVSLDNYRQILQGKSVEVTSADGTRQTVRGDDFSTALLNSLTVAVACTVIPIV